MFGAQRLGLFAVHRRGYDLSYDFYSFDELGSRYRATGFMPEIYCVAHMWPLNYVMRFAHWLFHRHISLWTGEVK